MKSREELRNDYEEALFAMIMDEIMELEGATLIAERERLAESDADKVPDAVNERCIAVIHETFAAKDKASRRSGCRKALRTVLVAAVVMSILVTSVCALVPSVKEKVVELAVEFSDGIVQFTTMHTNEVESQRKEYSLGYIPEGLDYCAGGYDESSMWKAYVSKDDGDEKIHFIVQYDFDLTVTGFDHEKCISENISFGMLEGLLIYKNDRWQAALYDAKNRNYLDIVFENIDKKTIYEVLYNIRSE